ncbi:hypothetical protein JCM3766R1_005373 [Sporobolomyces carnicolor]
METVVDPITLRYLDRLPLAFSSIPRFSSSASHSLASRQAGLHSSDLTTKCLACRAEVIGGNNGSYWTEKGELWLRCDGCGWTTKRTRVTGEGNGKNNFESVRKRTREQERRVKEASSHPTQFRGPALPNSKQPDTSSAKVVPESKKNVDVVPEPASASSLAATPLPLGPSRSPSAAPTTASSSARQSPAPSATSTSTPTSLDSKLASTSKKRKRPKQPNGLAELLAKKKKDDGAASGGGAKLGLQDFLQGL